MRALFVEPAGPTAPPAGEDPAVARREPKVRGLRIPLAGHPIPSDPVLLPDSPRAYRAGVHEGIDLAARQGTPVLAAADGVIVRIDGRYVEPSLAARSAALAAALRLGYTPGATLDMVRGRQVWIDHGHGIVTRYCHLSSVAALPLGAHVRAGEVIGAVGSSGLPENGPHLHFEIRVGDDFLGDGLTGAELRKVIDLAFE
ncbi:MAG: M23 family metallopeptidase [Chloroflexota bacterium]|nr:M23 family metallopeptidase [Chloroflexota bacterium]